MLRITVHENAGELRFHLEGRLAGPWVDEVERCWQAAAPGLSGRAVTVDLREVDFVDPAGEQLLRTLHQRGARFATGCPFMRYLLAAIKRRSRPSRQIAG